MSKHIEPYTGPYADQINIYLLIICSRQSDDEARDILVMILLEFRT